MQEMSHHVPTGGVPRPGSEVRVVGGAFPRSISVLVQGDLTRQVLAGDAITLTGAPGRRSSMISMDFNA